MQIRRSFTATLEIKRLKRLLDYYYILSRQKLDSLELSRKIKIQYDLEIHRAKQSSYENIISTAQNKSRTVWTNVNSLISEKKVTSTPRLPQSENLCTLAEEFNHSFINLAPNLVKDSAPSGPKLS
ncbi:hypothetical protein HHI36_008448 [Cryptolaemus montrouzieri]|uniref:Uncharacterized protein n=1 Tax=Cryptolaemus montrouzieri TaxID=559131 RepID=A0ABD2MSQ3_9CUCU